MLNLNKYQAMYAKKDEGEKEWYVCAVESDGWIHVFRQTFKTKKEANNFIRSYGLKPCKPMT